MATVSALHYSNASIFGTSSTNTKTSTSFTPTANSLLILCGWLATDQAASGENWTVSSTHSGVGAWAQAVTAEVSTFSTYTTRASIWYATVGASPGSGTVTMTHDAGTNYRMMAMSIRDATALTGPRAGQTATSTGTSSTPTLSPPSSVLSDSLVVTAAFCVNDTINATDPTSFSDFGSLDGDGDRLEAAYDDTPSGSSFQWSGIGDSSNPSALCLVEFAAPAGSAFQLKRGLYVPGFAGRSGRGGF